MGHGDLRVFWVELRPTHGVTLPRPGVTDLERNLDHLVLRSYFIAEEPVIHPVVQGYTKFTEL